MKPFSYIEMPLCGRPLKSLIGSMRRKRVQQKLGITTEYIAMQRPAPKVARTGLRKRTEREKTLARERYAANKEKHNQQARRWHRKMKAEVMQKYGGACKGCGITETAVLTIDHINDDGGRERIILSSNNLYIHLHRAKELRKDLQILCFNCQWRKRVYGPNIELWKEAMASYASGR